MSFKFLEHRYFVVIGTHRLFQHDRKSIGNPISNESFKLIREIKQFVAIGLEMIYR